MTVLRMANFTNSASGLLSGYTGETHSIQCGSETDQTGNTVKLYDPGKKGRIFLASILTGIVVGALIGYATGDDSGWFALNAGEKAFVGGLLGAGAGSAVGGIIASGTEKKFLVNGDWESLQEMKESLQNNKLGMIIYCSLAY